MGRNNNDNKGGKKSPRSEKDTKDKKRGNADDGGDDEEIMDELEYKKFLHKLFADTTHPRHQFNHVYRNANRTCLISYRASNRLANPPRCIR